MYLRTFISQLTAVSINKLLSCLYSFLCYEITVQENALTSNEFYFSLYIQKPVPLIKRSLEKECSTAFKKHDWNNGMKFRFRLT